MPDLWFETYVAACREIREFENPHGLCENRRVRAGTYRHDGFSSPPDDQPSVSIILRAEKDDIEVAFALKTKTDPVGVAEYELQPRLPAEFKGRLPTARQLAIAMREAMQ